MRRGPDIVLKINDLLEARFDGDNRAHTCVSGRFNGTMTGLCGNMDDNAVNDIVTASGQTVPDDKMTGHIQIGDSWQISDVEEQRHVQDV